MPEPTNKLNVPAIVKETEKPVYLNCTFNYNYPTNLIPLQLPQGTQKEKIVSDEEFNKRLIDYIIETIGIKLPPSIIEDILKAESEFFQKYE